jgi:isoquinoline 1-oxidoreductase beta subunit
MLIQAAAEHWNVAASECSTEQHTVVHKVTGRRTGYGELASEAARITVPKKEQLQLKQPSQWRYVGKGMTSVDLEKLCTGKAMYGMDARLDGMLYASICSDLRRHRQACPRFAAVEQQLVRIKS